MDTASPDPHVASNRIGKITIIVEWEGIRTTIEAPSIISFDVEHEYERFPPDLSRILNPRLEKMKIGFEPLKDEATGVQYTVKEEQIEKEMQGYINGLYVFPYPELGRSRSRFEDREKATIRDLGRLGLYAVNKRKPHVMGEEVYFIYPKQGRKEYFTAPLGSTVEILNGKVRVTTRDGREGDWLTLP